MVIIMNKRIEMEMIKLLNKAIHKNEVPVAAIITMNNKIIAKTYNKREKNKNIIGHAEILCILKAAKKLKTWKLDQCDLYVSLEPCSMCKKIIQEARISNVYYFAEKLDSKKEYNNTKYNKIEDNHLINIIKEKMNMFFIKKRR